MCWFDAGDDDNGDDDDGSGCGLPTIARISPRTCDVGFATFIRSLFVEQYVLFRIVVIYCNP